MDGVVVGAVVGITGLTIVNVAVVAFSYGRMTQKLKDLCQRVDKLEFKVNGKISRGG